MHQNLDEIHPPDSAVHWEISLQKIAVTPESSEVNLEPLKWFSERQNGSKLQTPPFVVERNGGNLNITPIGFLPAALEMPSYRFQLRTALEVGTSRSQSASTEKSN